MAKVADLMDRIAIERAKARIATELPSEAEYAREAVRQSVRTYLQKLRCDD